MQTRHHESHDCAQPLDCEHGRGQYAGPRVYREHVALVERAVLGLARFLVHVHGVQPQRGHHVRECVQHNVRQRHARFFASSYHENGCKNVTRVQHQIYYPLKTIRGMYNTHAVDANTRQPPKEGHYNVQR